MINSALLCYLEHQADCTGFLAQATIGQVRNDHDVMGCPEVTLTTDEVRTEPVTTPPPPLTILTCPRVPPYLPTSSAPNLPSPVIHPSTANRDCIEYDPRQLQHCSMFGFSSLRPFRSYRSGLEACNVPGSWYLLRHRTVTVEVEGMASGEAADHTIISKVSPIIIHQFLQLKRWLVQQSSVRQHPIFLYCNYDPVWCRKINIIQS